MIDINVYLIKVPKNITRKEHLEKIREKIHVETIGRYEELINMTMNYSKESNKLKTHYTKIFKNIYGRGVSVSPSFDEKSNIPSVVFYVKQYNMTSREYRVCEWGGRCRWIMEHELAGNYVYVLDMWAVYPFTVIRLVKAVKSKNVYAKWWGVKRHVLARIKIPNEIYDAGIYVVWRRMRYFVSAVVDLRNVGDLAGVVMTDNVAFGQVSGEEIAYYYAGVLNALAYIVSVYRKRVEDLYGIGLTFARGQFLRPMIFLHRLGLDWQGLGWQYEVAGLSRKLHVEAPRIYGEYYGLSIDKLYELIDGGRDKEYWKKYRGKNVDKNLEILKQKSTTYRKLLQIIQEQIDEEKLRRNLAWVLETSGGTSY